MVKIIPFGLIVVMLLFSLTESSLVQAKGSGYKGLIVTSPESRSNTSSSSKQGASAYGGLIALAPQKNKTLGSQKEQPLGYSGLIQGRIKKPQLQMTKVPGKVPRVAPRSSDDLKSLAQRYGYDRDGDLLPDVLRKPKVLSKGVKSMLAGPRIRIKGKLPMVYMIEQKIAKLMSKVESKNISTEVRTENARKAYNELAVFARGLRSKKAVPNNIYRRMGLSETFIEEEKTGTSNALDQLNKTLKKLKEYE